MPTDPDPSDPDPTDPDPSGPAAVLGDPRPWDLLVVGGGTAGIVGATTAAQLGARVLLVESDRTGGECLWTGCVPSKALLAAAAAAQSARSAARLGVAVEGVRVDGDAVRAHVRAAIARIAPEDSPRALRAAGVAVVAGRVVFTGPAGAAVDGRPVRFRQALLATGSDPVVPDLAGDGSVPVVTNESVWDLPGLPDPLVVLGGGGVGCELAQAHARLGSRVTLLEAGDRLLAGEDPDAAALVSDALQADGVVVRTGVRATGLSGGRVLLADSSGVPAAVLLAAVGRRARTGGLGLAAAGVRVGGAGDVVVDRHLRTTNPRVWAAGDVTGRPRFTHVAGVDAGLAVSNALLGLRRSVAAATPRVTFTDPELAAVGDTAAEGRVPPGGRVRTLDSGQLDRAVAEGRTAGFTRLVTDRRGRVVAGTVVGPRAGETLGEVSLAVTRGLRLVSMAAATHAYPTWSDGVWNQATGALRESLAGPAVGRVVAGAVTVRRWWLDRRPAAL